ncbi:MAG: hypothetical protein K8S00_12070 [Bacteroidales bacterium]|nr:hypothetical protein [Bacteroidales bacterium]
MNNINKLSEDNLGGLEKFWIVLAEHVNGILYNAIAPNLKLELIPTGSLYHIYCTADNLQFSEEKKNDFNGDHYQCKLEGICPNNYNDLQLILEELDTKEFLIIFKDNNGNYKLFGQLNEPLTLNNNYSSTPNYAGLNAHRLTFSRKMKKRSKFILDPFV